MRRLALEIVAGLALALAVFFVGRATAPDTVREESRERVADTSLTSNVVETSGAERVIVKWRDRVVVRPDGTRTETRETVTDNEKRAERRETAIKVQTRVEVKERIVYRERSAHASPPRLVLSLAAGTTIPPRHLPSVIPGLPSRLVLSATASVRVLGPVYAGITVTSAGAVLVGASVSF